MNRLQAVDMAGAVDLDEIDCRGCKYASSKGACKRFPPIFRPPVPTIVNGQPALQEGGWVFPPAIRKCGEYTSGVVTS